MDAVVKKIAMFAIAIWALALFANSVHANNILVENISLASADTNNYAMVEFDLSWDNSWRTSSAPDNYDGAWVIVKYQIGGIGNWSHATLNTTSGNHTAVAGSVIEAVSDGKGVFIYRDADGSGTNNWDNLRLRWEYGTDGVSDTDSVTFKIFAIEMVNIPAGGFWVGDGYDAALQNTFAETEITDVITQIVEKDGSPIHTLSAAMRDAARAEFWMAKYEVTQGQYADFLNTITTTQAGNRYPGWNGSDRHTISGTYPNHSASAPDRACNYLKWDDTLYYCDWAALRPMTELEFEKAARGPGQPGTSGVYAWGTIAIASLDYGLSDDGTASARVTTNYGTGNANYGGTSGTLNGPLRAGIFATATSSRAEAGAGYYGVMELTGNLWEHIVNVTATSFDFVKGDGDIAALPANWPSAASGKGFRGGDWANAADTHQRVASRYVVTDADVNRLQTVGFRPCR